MDLDENFTVNIGNAPEQHIGYNLCKDDDSLYITITLSGRSRVSVATKTKLNIFFFDG